MQKWEWNVDEYVPLFGLIEYGRFFKYGLIYALLVNKWKCTLADMCMLDWTMGNVQCKTGLGL